MWQEGGSVTRWSSVTAGEQRMHLHTRPESKTYLQQELGAELRGRPMTQEPDWIGRGGTPERLIEEPILSIILLAPAAAESPLSSSPSPRHAAVEARRTIDKLVLVLAARQCRPSNKGADKSDRGASATPAAPIITPLVCGISGSG